jgi:cytochrome c553
VRFAALTTIVALAMFTAMQAVGQVADTRSRGLAATCANCHGTGGVSVGDLPSLAGRPREEIVRMMQEFKSGARQGTIMNQLAKGYTDEQIEALAGWFAAQRAPK